MKKELILRVMRIVIAMVLGLILFAYLEDSIVKHKYQITLFFLFSSIIVGIISLLLFFLIKIVFKNGEEDKLQENIYYIVRLALMSVFTAYGLTIFEIHWVLLTLIGVEIIGELLNNEFERQSNRT